MQPCTITPNLVNPSVSYTLVPKCGHASEPAPLLVPVTEASVECAISALKLVKTEQRSTTTDDRIIVIHFHVLHARIDVPLDYEKAIHLFTHET